MLKKLGKRYNQKSIRRAKNHLKSQIIRRILTPKKKRKTKLLKRTHRNHLMLILTIQKKGRH